MNQSVPLYRALARAVEYLHNIDSRAARWNWTPDHVATMRARGKANLAALVSRLPHGSGIDSEVILDESSTSNRLVITFDFHNMDSNGFYCGWTSHKAIVKSSLAYDFDLRVTGGAADLRDYLHEAFDCALRELVDPYLGNREA